MKTASRKKYLSPEETAMFCEQIVLVLKAGIPLYDGVETLCATYQNSRYGDTFRLLDSRMKETGSLYEALEAVDIFPPYMVHTIKIAEQAGTMEAVMQGLALYYRREAQIKKAIRHAISYPLVLVAMMSAVIVVLVVRVLPIFQQVFRNLGTAMSDTSVAIMNFGLAAGTAVLVLVVVLLLAALIIFLLLRTRYRERVQAFLGRMFPLLGEIRQKTAAARFSSVMAMMLSSGFPMDEAMAMVPEVLDDSGAKAQVENCRKQMQEGVSFPDAVEASGIYSGMQEKMIRVAYMAGQMDTAMYRLAEMNNEELDDGIRRIVSMIEPALVALLSVIIGAVLLAVMLPLASILSSMA